MLSRAKAQTNHSGNQSKEISRDAGILLHITSLPSAFGIGDLGPEAYAFVDFLSRCNQHYWQILPLNPIAKEQHYSPYSSISSMAGNSLLISPELLASQGLIKSAELSRYKIVAKGQVVFDLAEEVRQILLQKAASRFFKNPRLLPAFEKFCRDEAYWLNDFALYQALKKHHHNKPWFEWSDEFTMRSKSALNKFSREVLEFCRYTMWLQFVFFAQWSLLKTYANKSGVQLFGDLPFYVSHDSSDVWANRDIFNVDKNGLMTGVAGVPPDYFNSNGQLWGMPTFKWAVLKKQRYGWWIKRLKKNLQMFDLLRLDHFRAFASYWEVPSGEITAIRGTWKSGPGNLFFKAIQSAIGELRFVAEDLGDVDENVFVLRDNYRLPGMKILQFAFGDTMPESDYIPHNYGQNFIAYTGTHDNNTTVGWFSKDLSGKGKKQISSYTGKQVNEKNVHIELSRLAYASVARTAILPLQDVLGLDEKARMNTPASVIDNWGWRFKRNALTKSIERRLQHWVTLYNR